MDNKEKYCKENINLFEVEKNNLFPRNEITDYYCIFLQNSLIIQRDVGVALYFVFYNKNISFLKFQPMDSCRES
jgi:hypothetical protein